MQSENRFRALQVRTLGRADILGMDEEQINELLEGHRGPSKPKPVRARRPATRERSEWTGSAGGARVDYCHVEPIWVRGC